MLKMVQYNEWSDLFFFVCKKLAILIGPVMIVSLIIGVASQLLQTGFLQVEDALTPNWERLNPLAGLQKIFSLKGFIELFKSMIKVVVIMGCIYFLLKSEIKEVPYLSNYSIQEIFVYIGKILFKLLMGTGLFMLILSVADYFFQRWQKVSGKTSEFTSKYLIAC